MNPFEQPPVGPPVSPTPRSDAGHDGAGHDGPRRGRMALAALAAAGLVGGGVVVAGQLASADRPSLDSAATVDDPAPEPDAPSGDGLPSVDGEIVIDDGDGDPFVLDLGALGECLGPIFGGSDRDAGPLFDERFEQRMEEFLDGLDLDDLELGQLGEVDDGGRIFGSGGSTVTVVGPDGVHVIDLGEGDATVTLEQTDGELTIETDGDATVGELPDLGEILPELDLGELDPGDWSERLPFDPGAIESCLDDIDPD